MAKHANMAEEVILKRRRVTQACESCRSLKSKCDGKRPVCSRCKGYGYECRWRDRHNHIATPGRRSSVAKDDKNELESLRHVAHTSREILSSIRDKLDTEDQRRIDSILSITKESNLQSPVASPTGTSRCLELLEPFRRSSLSAYRYLGDISDVSFFNSVKGLLQNDPSRSDRKGTRLESYEREAAEVISSPETEAVDSSFPDRNAADKYITIYFTTIHIAYPFIDRKRFLEDYEKYLDNEQRSGLSSISIALLFTVFAIGSYYDVCTMSTEQSASLHYAYFHRALVAANCVESDYSVDNVRVLLVQCFYLLLAQWTDRCWLTLGLAIRIAQSIGLHIEKGQIQSPCTEQVATELYRRTWHSLYVLDRLLSIQLGRPSAIRNQDCTVRLPSRLDDVEFDTQNDRIPQSNADEPNTGDYLIAVIKLSAILRHVERDIYRPDTMDYSEAMLQRTEHLDAELLRWRSQLPRWLRFDRGHTFERLAVLKRQRNMLAIKFHHLRALIHRPYLCLPWLQRNDNNIKQLLDSNAHRVVYFERICVQEAQATAHLLHDISDKKSLVENFPWWQMISCLTCASSVLLVMRAFTPSSSPADDVQREILEEDANTCLKVFDALSLNSDGARRARDMLQNLRDIKVADDKLLDMGLPNTSNLSPKMNGIVPEWHGSGDQRTSIGSEDSPSFAAFTSDPETMDERFSGNFAANWNRHAWPSEMADSMAWSSQFVDAAWDPLLELSADQSWSMKGRSCELPLPFKWPNSNHELQRGPSRLPYVRVSGR